MKKTPYLYGVEPSSFASLPYRQALQFKVDAARKLIIKLLKPHYLKRDDYRLNSVISAQKFNQKLLEELE